MRTANRMFRHELAACVQYSLTVLAAAVFLIGWLSASLNGMLSGVALLWAGNLAWACRKFRERIVFFLFNCSCMFFLFGRNVVELLEGTDWTARFSFSTNQTILRLLFLSLLLLLIGAAVVDRLPNRPKPVSEKREIDLAFRRRNLQIVAFVLFCFCMVFSLMREFDKLLFMQGKEYYQYYAEYTPRLPSLFNSIGALAKYMMILFLITLPSKKACVFVLALYFLNGVPMFLIGQRQGLLSICLFIFVYFILRDYLGQDAKKWVGKKETILLILAIPLGLAFLSLYEQIRYGRGLGEVNLWSSVLNLFRSQGVTYDVVSKGIDQIPNLPDTNVSYTFGPWIKYWQENFISNFLFGTQPFQAQTVESALYANSFADTISYLELGEEYLKGAGLGSSYLIETYVDFGWIGTALHSGFVGMVTVAIIKYFQRSLVAAYLAMNILLMLFLSPRASALGWGMFIFYIPMYLILLIVAILTGLCYKQYQGKNRALRKEMESDV